MQRAVATSSGDTWDYTFNEHWTQIISIDYLTNTQKKFIDAKNLAY